MSRKTDGKDNTVHYQMDRFALQNGAWFYATRESDERGPFTNKCEAERDLKLYLSNDPGIGASMWKSQVSRKNDRNDNVVYFQTDRFAVQNGKWFYDTREAVERGPFTYKSDAVSDLSSYIYHRHNIEKYSH